MLTFLKFYRLYKRAMWYAGVFIGEVDKPLTIIKYASYGAIIFKLFGLSISVGAIAWVSIISMICAIALGAVLVKIGAVTIDTGLGNSQNKELLEIQAGIKQLLHK